MEKYQFNMLMWLTISNAAHAKIASDRGWYEGPGWYLNPVPDEPDQPLPRCVAKRVFAKLGLPSDQLGFSRDNISLTIAT